VPRADWRARFFSAPDRIAFLRTNSGLPGPRANLELLSAAAEEVDRPWAYAWAAARVGTDPTDVFVISVGVVALVRFAAAGNSAPRTLNDLQGARIATSYPHVLTAFLSRHGLTAHLVRLDGAVESAIRLGVADVIADVVETGSALRQNGLEVFGPVILDSHAVLIGRKGIATTDALDLMLRRLRGVLVAHNYVMVDYDVPAAAVAEASRLTPGLESPTVSPLAREGWFAVRAMVPRADSQQLMDELWDCGARAILLTDIHACRI